MVDLPIEKLIVAIENGKVRGFDEIKEINGENYFSNMPLKNRMKNTIPIFSKYQKIKWKCSKIMQLKKLVRFPI